MNIAVVGTGYVGLVTGTCLAETGNHVVCIDIDEEKVNKLNNNIIPIYEPGLDVFFDRNVSQGRLQFTTQLAEGIKDAEVIFLALPTPPGEDGSADLKYVLGVADDLGKILDHYAVIVDKSTVPVGTADKVHARIAANAKVEFDVVSNPEFLREGVAVEDFMKPDRIVVGTQADRARKIMERLFAPYVRQGNPIIFMDEKSAELTKYAANSFLAAKITFMNEVAHLCQRFGANVDDIRRGLGPDERIGRRFLFAGIGYGGSCFPKDVKALVKSSDDVGYDFKMLKAVEAVNATQKVMLVPAVEDYFGGSLAGKTVAIWGLSFKPYTDDIREAPALENIKLLLAKGAKVRTYDPEAMENVRALLGDSITLCDDQYSAAEGADCLMIMTEWPVFRTPDFALLSNKLKNKVVFDGRNVYDLDALSELGYTYVSIGRPTINPQQ